MLSVVVGKRSEPTTESKHLLFPIPTMREYRYYVYMMQSTSRHALYIGITSKLTNRVWQHKNHVVEGFTEKYHCDRLVYYEIYDQVRRAIAREKQLKGWRREKKERLIAELNPHWKDLSEGWFEAETKGPSTAAANPCRLRSG